MDLEQQNGMIKVNYQVYLKITKYVVYVNFMIKKKKEFLQEYIKKITQKDMDFIKLQIINQKEIGIKI